MKMTEVESVEDIEIKGEEILVWDGCDFHIDYVECCVDTGDSYMANSTNPTHWMKLEAP